MFSTRNFQFKPNAGNLFAAMLFVLLCGASLSFAQQSNPVKDVRFYLRQAAKARQEKNYAALIESIKAALELRPGHPTYTYNLACAFALNNDSAKALELLEKLAAMGLIYAAEKDEDLASVKDNERFKSVVKEFEANKLPVGSSAIALTLAQKGLITESVAYDSQTEAFFLSSIYRRKIVSVDKNGTVKDFSSDADGLWSVMGIKVDTKRRHLWVCTAAHPQMANFKAEENGMSAVFKYDLTSGKLIKKYQLSNQPKPRWLGDLVVSKNGGVFVSDSLNPQVYKISRQRIEYRDKNIL